MTNSRLNVKLLLYFSLFCFNAYNNEKAAYGRLREWHRSLLRAASLEEVFKSCYGGHTDSKVIS
jgi:hypothetical protein